jgi:hypothetical protein
MRTKDMTKWIEVTRSGLVDKSTWRKLKPLTDERHAMALRIYGEHGAQARGEPYGIGDDARAANGTVAEAQFADHYGLTWTGGVTVADPRSILSDVGSNIQCYASPDAGGRLIVHLDELVKDQIWVHLIGVAPDMYFVGWTTVANILFHWPEMDGDPRQTGGRVYRRIDLIAPSEFERDFRRLTA